VSAIPIVDFGLGPRIPDSAIPEITTTRSTPDIRTRTKTSSIGSATASLFLGFHPHIGHGPVVPGKGFNSPRKAGRKPNNGHSNSNCGCTVGVKGFDHNDPNFNSTLLKPSTSCKYFSLHSKYEKSVSTENLLRERLFNKKKPSHMTRNYSIEGRYLPSFKFDPYEGLYPDDSAASSTPSNELSPYQELHPHTSTAKHQASSAPARPKILDLNGARRELDEKIAVRKIMIKYYQNAIGEAEDDIDGLKKHSSSGPREKYFGYCSSYVRNFELHLAHEKEELNNLEAGRAKLDKKKDELGDSWHT
jgi:hypothetical protein